MIQIDPSVPYSPDWWFKQLLGRLNDRRPRLDRLDRYYDGRCDLPEGAEGCEEAYRRFQAKARANWSELIVEAVRERMQPVGFRTGAEGDELGDRAALRIWQANSLDADASLVIRAALTMSVSYVIVGGVDPEIGAPVITPEDPRQVITAHDPIRRRKVVAALKVFHDEDAGLDRAYVYTPGWVSRASKKASAGDTMASGVSGWSWDEDTVRAPNPGRLPAPVVPVVRFENRARLGRPPMGEFEPFLDKIDRINHLSLQELVIVTTQAFRQRALKGQVPDTDAQGNPIDLNGLFLPSPGALWQLPEGVDLWESGQADLGGILQSRKQDVQELAAMSRTPLHYMFPDAANGSAEGAATAKEGLLFKTTDRMGQQDDSWEWMMALGFLFAGDKKRAQLADLETLWMSPDRRSLAERADANAKAKAGDVPWRTRMTEIMEYSPQEAARMETERMSEAFTAAAFAPPAPAGPPRPPAAPPTEEAAPVGAAR